MLPVNSLREIARLFPAHQDRLDEWQRGFVADQLHRLEKWGDEIRISDKQSAVLEKALAAMQGGEA